MRRRVLLVVLFLVCTLWSTLPVFATGNSSGVVIISGTPLMGCSLNISSGIGGNVTVPGEGTFFYSIYSVHNLSAESNLCYHFVNWSGDTTEIADVNSSDTIITMNSSYTISANFALSTYNLSITESPIGYGSPYFNGSNPFNCSTIVDIHANTSTGYVFAAWTPSDGVGDPSLEDTTVNMSQNRSLVAHYIKYSTIQPPTNLSFIPKSTSCFNMTWTKGINSSSTVMVACRDTNQSCWDTTNISNSGNLSDGCWVLYNGSGTTFNSDSCGLDLDLFQYHITAWGTNGSSDYSMTCTSITIGGAKMIQMMFWWLGIGFAVIFFILALWQRQWWLFMVNGLIWFILMAFTFTQYTTSDMMYWFGFVYLIMAIICIGCVFWFREKHEHEDITPEETQDEKREKRSNKLAGLRNLTGRISGRDR